MQASNSTLETLSRIGFQPCSKDMAPIVSSITLRADALPSIHAELVQQQGVLDAHDPVTLEVRDDDHIRAVVYSHDLDSDDEDATDGVIYAELFVPIASAQGQQWLKDVASTVQASV